jgi:predicted PurR-regulated permease PerM
LNHDLYFFHSKIRCFFNFYGAIGVHHTATSIHISPPYFCCFFLSAVTACPKKIQKLIPSTSWSAGVTLIVLLMILVAAITIFSFQIVEVFQNIPEISNQLKTGLNQVFDWLDQRFGISKNDGIVWIRDNFSRLLETPLAVFQQGLTTSTRFLLHAFLSLITVFFLLAYKATILKVVLLQFSSERKSGIRQLLRNIQKAVSSYLSGLLLVILILAVLNSLGLWLIGVGYPVFFGILAALLVIIPYFGTTIGGLIPLLYSIATYEYWWQPLAVIGMYFSIQQLEGNLITPNVVGSSVRINFLVAFLALIIGGTLWGLAGVVLSLPVAGILKIIFDAIPFLKPLGLLMSNDLYLYKEVLAQDWDNADHRLSSLFRKSSSD